jgi:hypothetical protein
MGDPFDAAALLEALSAHLSARDAALAAAQAARDAERDAALAAAQAARDTERDAALAAAQAARDAAHAREIARLAAEVARVREELRRREGGAPLPSSTMYATAGSEVLEALRRLGAVAALAAPPAGASADELAPLAAPADLAALRACARESELVEAATPLLSAARGFGGDAADPCAPLLVNSEDIKWLDALHAPMAEDQRKKPDLFATWEPLWSGRHEPGRGAVGRLAHRALQIDGCAREFYEAKLGAGNLTAGEFGQLVDYHSRVFGDVRGVLFNAREVWLYGSLRDRPLRLVQTAWDAPGSRAALRRFFEDDAPPEPPLVPLLRHLLASLGVAPERVPVGRPGAGNAQSLLGVGGTARVFCVRRAGVAAPLALKAAVGVSRGDLEYEFRALGAAHKAGAPVAAIMPDSLVFFTDAAGRYVGGGFLLRDVLAPAPAADTASRVAAHFAALHGLHECGFAHGDARVPNLLAVGRAGGAAASLVWVDLRAATSGPGADMLVESQRADAFELARSVLATAGRGARSLPAGFEDAVKRLPLGGAEAYAAVAAEVWRALSVP